MADLLAFFAALNSLTPLAIIALLATIIYLQVKQHDTAHTRHTQLQTNDLHELPEMAATLRRIELKLSEEFAHVRARLNGR